MNRKQSNPKEDIRNIMKIDELLEGVDLIYVYPHHRIELNDEELCQTRSGPNWEGEVLTIATCKHLLRTYKTLKPNTVALVGITNKLEGNNYLLYAGVIEGMFDSNYKLGKFLKEYYPETYKKKLATTNPLGDIFEPDDSIAADPYDVFDFEEPCEDHCRFAEKDSSGQPKYHKDIEYTTRHGRQPKCLTLNPVTVHTTPNFIFTGKLGRSGLALKGDDAVEQLMEMLEEEL